MMVFEMMDFRLNTFRIIMLPYCGLLHFFFTLSFGVNGGGGGRGRHAQEVKSPAFFLLGIIWVFIKRPVKPILRQKTRI